MNTVLPKHLWSFIWYFLKPYKKIVAVYITLAIGAGFWGPFNNLLIKHIVNILSLSGDGNQVIMPCILLVLNFIIFDNITWRIIGYINYKFYPLIYNTIVHTTFEYVLGSSYDFFHNNLSGKISNQIDMLADNISYILHPLIADFLRGSSLLFIAFISTYSVNITFFYIISIWFIVFSLVSIRMSRHLVGLAHAHTYAQAHIAGTLVDSISNINNIKLFARSEYETERLNESLEISKKAFKKKEFFLILLYFIQGMLIACMLAAMVYYLLHLYKQKVISIGDFSLILGLSMEVAYCTWHTMGQVNEFFQAVGKCKQSLASLIVPHSIQDESQAHLLKVSQGSIIFNHVTFHYKDTLSFFHNLSITIKAGQKVGLVGYSGSGKSTFINLILRLYDVNHGHIYIDKQDIKHVTQDSLHTNITIIPQEPSLFHRSIMENIRYGKLNATDEEVIEAAKKAHIHDTIVSMPEGYNTQVGERGTKLSGGQRQRVAIARAILKNAPILILDEATSALDAITEQSIQKSIDELMKDKTTLVIAHRLSTLLHMDRILVFDKGRIVQEGTHQELIHIPGLYKTLWETQNEGFIGDNK